MTEDLNSNGEGFLRQRRNLIIGCLLVLFLETTVSPPEGLTILGVTLKVTRAEYIVYWIWGFTVYWLVRFFQYLPKIEKILESAKAEYKYSLKKFLKDLPEWEHPLGGEASKKYFVHAEDIYFIDPIKFTSITFAFQCVHLKVEASGSWENQPLDPHQSMTVGSFKSMWLSILSWMAVCIRTPLFTEYVVPILLFFMAIISSLHRLG